MRFSTICKGEQLFAPPKYGVFFGLVQTPGCLDLRLQRGSCKLLTDAILNFGFAILDGKSPTAQSV